jgi:hypothetical protein
MPADDQNEPVDWRKVLRWAAGLAPLHAALPFAFSWVERQHGRTFAQGCLVAVHLLFPFAYVSIGERVPLTFAHWAVLLGLNHLGVLVGLVLLWLG